MEASIGRIVHYSLNGTDAQVITERRQRLGGQHNKANPGDTYPAIVVRKWSETLVNLRVILDGNDDYWATSRNEGEGNGTWAWPPRV